MLNDLFERGVAVKVLEGMAAGDHTQRSLLLDNGRDIAALHRRFLSERIKGGLQAARGRGHVGGRPVVVNDGRRAWIRSKREQGESIRAIARSIGVSVGTVHNALAKEQRAARTRPRRQLGLPRGQG